MAKCIRNKVTKNITRVSDEDAAKNIKTGKYEYCSKTEWKNSGRK